MLEELYASFNFIFDIYDLTYSENLTVLDLEGNAIQLAEQLKSLRYLAFLMHLNIKGNPILNNKSESSKIKELLPDIESIVAECNECEDTADKENYMPNRMISIGVKVNDVQEACDNYVREDILSEEDKILNEMKVPKPKTEQEAYDISNELAVAGNAMNALRTKKKILFSNRKDCGVDKLINEFEKDAEIFNGNIKTKLRREVESHDI